MTDEFVENMFESVIMEGKHINKFLNDIKSNYVTNARKLYQDYLQTNVKDISKIHMKDISQSLYRSETFKQIISMIGYGYIHPINHKLFSILYATYQHILCGDASHAIMNILGKQQGNKRKLVLKTSGFRVVNKNGYKLGDTWWLERGGESKYITLHAMAEIIAQNMRQCRWCPKTIVYASIQRCRKREQEKQQYASMDYDDDDDDDDDSELDIPTTFNSTGPSLMRNDDFSSSSKNQQNDSDSEIEINGDYTAYRRCDIEENQSSTDSIIDYALDDTASDYGNHQGNTHDNHPPNPIKQSPTKSKPKPKSFIDDEDEIEDFIQEVGDHPKDCVEIGEFLNYHLLSLDFATNCNIDSLRVVLLNLIKHELKDMKPNPEWQNRYGKKFKWEDYFLLVEYFIPLLIPTHKSHINTYRSVKK